MMIKEIKDRDFVNLCCNLIEKFQDKQQYVNIAKHCILILKQKINPTQKKGTQNSIWPELREQTQKRCIEVALEALVKGLPEIQEFTPMLISAMVL